MPALAACRGALLSKKRSDIAAVSKGNKEEALVHKVTLAMGLPCLTGAFEGQQREPSSDKLSMTQLACAFRALLPLLHAGKGHAGLTEKGPAEALKIAATHMTPWWAQKGAEGACMQLISEPNLRNLWQAACAHKSDALKKACMSHAKARSLEK